MPSSFTAFLKFSFVIKAPTPPPIAAPNGPPIAKPSAAPCKPPVSAFFNSGLSRPSGNNISTISSANIAMAAGPKTRFNNVLPKTGASLAKDAPANMFLTVSKTPLSPFSFCPPLLVVASVRIFTAVFFASLAFSRSFLLLSLRKLTKEFIPLLVVSVLSSTRVKVSLISAKVAIYLPIACSCRALSSKCSFSNIK